MLLVDHATQRGQRLLRLFDEVLQADDRRVGVVVRDDFVLLLGYVGIVHADDPVAVLAQNLESVVVATGRCHHVIVPESDQRHTADDTRHGAGRAGSLAGARTQRWWTSAQGRAGAKSSRGLKVSTIADVLAAVDAGRADLAILDREALWGSRTRHTPPGR